MTYQPQPGDIGLTQITGLGGKAIRFGQWLNGDGFDDYEHAFVVTEYRQGLPTIPWIVEAMPGGAQHVKNWHDPARTAWLKCPEQYREAVAAAARGYVGVPYSWADYGALALHRFHIPTPLLKRYVEDSGHMICSQLADRAAEDGGWQLFADRRWHGDVTPMDLRSLVK
jgi:hypothetical protein